MDNVYQEFFSNYDSDIDIMEKSLSIIVSKVNQWIESVIIGTQTQYVTNLVSEH